MSTVERMKLPAPIRWLIAAILTLLIATSGRGGRSFAADSPLERQVRAAWAAADPDRSFELQEVVSSARLPSTVDSLVVECAPGIVSDADATAYVLRGHDGDGAVACIVGGRPWPLTLWSPPTRISAGTFDVPSVEFDLLCAVLDAISCSRVRVANVEGNPMRRGRAACVADLRLAIGGSGTIIDELRIDVVNSPTTLEYARQRAKYFAITTYLQRALAASSLRQAVPDNVFEFARRTQGGDALIDALALVGDEKNIARLRRAALDYATRSDSDLQAWERDIARRIDRAIRGCTLPELRTAVELRDWLVRLPVTVEDRAARIRGYDRLARLASAEYADLMRSVVNGRSWAALDALQSARRMQLDPAGFVSVLSDDADPGAAVLLAGWLHGIGDGNLAVGVAERVWTRPCPDNLFTWNGDAHPRVAALSILLPLPIRDRQHLRELLRVETEPAVADHLYAGIAGKEDSDVELLLQAFERALRVPSSVGPQVCDLYGDVFEDRRIAAWCQRDTRRVERIRAAALIATRSALADLRLGPGVRPRIENVLRKLEMVDAPAAGPPAHER